MYNNLKEYKHTIRWKTGFVGGSSKEIVEAEVYYCRQEHRLPYWSEIEKN